MEYQKNLRNFLQGKYSESFFTLNSELEILKINQKASNLLKSIRTHQFKELALQLIKEKKMNLFQELLMFTDLDNAEYAWANKSERKKIIVSTTCLQMEGKEMIILILRDATLMMYNKK